MDSNMIMQALAEIKEDIKGMQAFKSAKKYGHKYPGFDDEMAEMAGLEEEPDTTNNAVAEGQKIASGGIPTRLNEEMGMMGGVSEEMEGEPINFPGGMEDEDVDMEDEDEETGRDARGETKKAPIRALAIKKIIMANGKKA